MKMMVLMMTTMATMMMMGMIVTLHYPLLLCFLTAPHSLLPANPTIPNVHPQNPSQSLTTSSKKATICHNPAQPSSAGHLSPTATGHCATSGGHRAPCARTPQTRSCAFQDLPPGELRAFLWFGHFHCFGSLCFALVICNHRSVLSAHVLTSGCYKVTRPIVRHCLKQDAPDHR